MLGPPMRLLHTFAADDDARLLGDALAAEGIESTVNESRNGGSDLWIHEEARMDEAKGALEEYLANPGAPRFVDMAREARSKQKAKARDEEKLRKRTEKVQRELERGQRPGVGTVTVGLILISVGFYLLGMGDEDRSATIAKLFRYATEVKLSRLPLVPFNPFAASLHEVRQGEPWRMITPIFLHGGFLHLFFNMWWLKDLGTMIERAHSSLYLGVLVLVIALLSNAMGYAFIGPNFVGMSGVVYGLFGFIWMRGRFDPMGALHMDPGLTVMLMLFFAFGFVADGAGLGFRIANSVHAGGLLTGAAWGYLSSGHLARRRPRRG